MKVANSLLFLPLAQNAARGAALICSSKPLTNVLVDLSFFCSSTFIWSLAATENERVLFT
jgi:hypothetical protein